MMTLRTIKIAAMAVLTLTRMAKQTLLMTKKLMKTAQQGQPPTKMRKTMIFKMMKMMVPLLMMGLTAI